MEQKQLDRINELYRLSKERALSDAELTEQKELRDSYRRSVVGNLTGQLENMTIVNPDGSTVKVSTLKKTEK
ncbi:MAG: DUF896 domain-containing protein [Oscillospiraceae bacterium]